MPAEAARFHRRLRPRDLWFVGLVACAVAVGTPAAILLSDTGSVGSRDGGQCVSAIEAGFMGGQTHRYCGQAAVTFCRDALRRSSTPKGCDAVLARVSD